MGPILHSPMVRVDVQGFILDSRSVQIHHCQEQPAMVSCSVPTPWYCVSECAISNHKSGIDKSAVIAKNKYANVANAGGCRINTLINKRNDFGFLSMQKVYIACV